MASLRIAGRAFVTFMIRLICMRRQARMCRVVPASKKSVLCSHNRCQFDACNVEFCLHSYSFTLEHTRVQSLEQMAVIHLFQPSRSLRSSWIERSLQASRSRATAARAVRARVSSAWMTIVMCVYLFFEYEYGHFFTHIHSEVRLPFKQSTAYSRISKSQ